MCSLQNLWVAWCIPGPHRKCEEISTSGLTFQHGRRQQCELSLQIPVITFYSFRMELGVLVVTDIHSYSGENRSSNIFLCWLDKKKTNRTWWQSATSTDVVHVYIHLWLLLQFSIIHFSLIYNRYFLIIEMIMFLLPLHRIAFFPFLNLS